MSESLQLLLNLEDQKAMRHEVRDASAIHIKPGAPGRKLLRASGLMLRPKCLLERGQSRHEALGVPDGSLISPPKGIPCSLCQAEEVSRRKGLWYLVGKWPEHTGAHAVIRHGGQSL